MIVAIIQARMASTRLPEKILKPIIGKPMLEHQIDRLRSCELIDKLVVATGDKLENKPLIEFCKKIGVDCFVGSEDDVLDRFYKANNKFGGDILVRLTADCPVIDPGVVDKVIRCYIDNDYDYVNNGIEYTYPDGLGAEVFSSEALATAWKEAVSKSDREHVTKYLRAQKGRFKIGIVKNNRNLSHHRWTVDNKEDLEFITKVYEELYPDKRLFLMDDIVELLEKKPELVAINSHISRDEGLKKSIREEYKLKFNSSHDIDRPNIGLWPSIISGDELDVAWYEYSSPYNSTPSDIFVAKFDSAFSDIEQLTTYEGYDNGPNIVKNDKIMIVSWHSWRPPGRGPFIEGSCENIWLKVKKAGVWGEPIMPFTSMSETAYPSIVWGGDRFYMVFTIEGKKEIYTSTSVDGIDWTQPKRIPYDNLLRADLIKSRDKFIIVAENESDESYIVTLESGDFGEWSIPKKIKNSDKGRRPKISESKNGIYYCVWHTDNWAAQQLDYDVESDGILDIEIDPEKSGGNNCFALNYIEVNDKKFDFGNKKSESAIKIGRASPLYSENLEYGFLKPVKGLMRSVATGYNSDLVYCDEKNTFRVKAKGLCKVKIVLSSWVSSAKRLTLSINGDVKVQPGDLGRDDIFYNYSKDLLNWSEKIQLESDCYDLNRPSKIVFDKNNKASLAFTCFDEKVKIRLVQEK